MLFTVYIIVMVVFFHRAMKLHILKHKSLYLLGERELLVHLCK